MDTAPPISGTYSKFIREPFGLNGPSTAPPMLDMMWPNWPPDLPSPKLLFHLCVPRARILDSWLICSFLCSALKYSSRTKCTPVASSMFLPSWNL
jgi:hypothetical protein